MVNDFNHMQTMDHMDEQRSSHVELTNSICDNVLLKYIHNDCSGFVIDTSLHVTVHTSIPNIVKKVLPLPGLTIMFLFFY